MINPHSLMEKLVGGSSAWDYLEDSILELNDAAAKLRQLPLDEDYPLCLNWLNHYTKDIYFGGELLLIRRKSVHSIIKQETLDYLKEFSSFMDDFMKISYKLKPVMEHHIPGGAAYYSRIQSAVTVVYQCINLLYDYVKERVK